MCASNQEGYLERNRLHRLITAMSIEEIIEGYKKRLESVIDDETREEIRRALCLLMN